MCSIFREITRCSVIYFCASSFFFTLMRYHHWFAFHVNGNCLFAVTIAPHTNKKMNVFGQKLTQFGQKYITRILFAHNVFFWTITLITPEINIIDYQFHLTSWSLFFIEKDKRNKIKGICVPRPSNRGPRPPNYCKTNYKTII